MSFRLPFWITVIIWKYTLIGLVASQTGNKGCTTFMKQDEMKGRILSVEHVICILSYLFIDLRGGGAGGSRQEEVIVLIRTSI